jgi:hypothetical protein
VRTISCKQDVQKVDRIADELDSLRSCVPTNDTKDRWEIAIERLDYAVVSSILYRSPCNFCGVFIRANHNSSFRCSASKPRCHQLQIFRPTFTPLVTGMPACTVSFKPRPSSSKFNQKTAAPFLGLNVTPSLPFSHSKKSHHLPSLLASNIGNSVPPPSHLALR